jgi:hypothetical protein
VPTPKKPAVKPAAKKPADDTGQRLDALLDTGAMKQARVRARVAENEAKRAKPKAPAVKVPPKQGLVSRRKMMKDLEKDF